LNGHPPHTVAIFNNEGSLLPDWRHYIIQPPLKETSYFNEGTSSYSKAVTDVGEISAPYFVIAALQAQYDETGTAVKSFGDALTVTANIPEVNRWMPGCEPITLARMVLPYIINGIENRAIWVEQWKKTTTTV
jgi:hypothetical protein